MSWVDDTIIVKSIGGLPIVSGKPKLYKGQPQVVARDLQQLKLKVEKLYLPHRLSEFQLLYRAKKIHCRNSGR